MNYTSETVAAGYVIGDLKPNYNMVFHGETGECGRLDFNGPAMIFAGNAEESAKIFFDWIAQYFAQRLLDERNAGLEQAAKICEAGLYEADEAFLENRGDEERVPYEAGQALRKSLAAAIRAAAAKGSEK